MMSKTPAINLYISNPTIAKEWHPTKNGSLTPKDVTLSFNRKVWWLCSNDHVWSATINERTQGNDCPYCSNKKVNDENSQEALNPSLAKEWHPTKNESLKVWWLCSNGHEWPATVNERNLGNDCPYCANKVKDEIIRQAFDPSQAEESHPAKNESLTPGDATANSDEKVSPENCLQAVNQNLAKESHPTRNESLTPRDVTAHSNKKISPENCLQAINPKLAKEWHPTKNESLTPRDVTANSHNQVWWLCSKGHEWKAAISNRNNGQGCFYCSYMKKGKRQ